jgi:predicted DNA-binding protein
MKQPKEVKEKLKILSGRTNKSKAVEEKECYRCLYYDRSVNNVEKYKVANKTIKRRVGHTKPLPILSMKGEDIYRMARVHERKTRDFNQINAS